MRYAANRGVEDLWDLWNERNLLRVGIFNVFVNMVFWKFDNNRGSKKSREMSRKV